MHYGFRSRPAAGSAAVHFFRLVARKAFEWGEDVWMARLDLEHAFANVSQASVLRGVADAHIKDDIVAVLAASCRHLQAWVQVDG